MKVTRLTHSCVRLEEGGSALVIDPGVWSEPWELLGADAVLLTHHHTDHADVLRLRGIGVPVFAPVGARLELEFTPVQAGVGLDLGDFRILPCGGHHAAVVVGEATCPNLGYIVNESIYHPGDALEVPDVVVDVAFVPVQAAWLKTAEAIAFARDLRVERTVGIHDGQVNRRGLESTNRWLSKAASHYRWLAPNTVI